MSPEDKPQTPTPTALEPWREEILRQSPELFAWFSREFNKWNDLVVTTAPLTAGPWREERNADSELMAISREDGAFYRYEGRHAETTRPDGSAFGWDQGVMITVGVEAQTPQGKVEVGGLVPVIVNSGGRYLVAIAQEVNAKTPKKIVVRTVGQTGAAKLNNLAEGKAPFDPMMMAMIDACGGLSCFFDYDPQSGIKATSPFYYLPSSDANRYDNENYTFVVPVFNEEMVRKFEEVGLYWADSKEIETLARAGLTNALTWDAINYYERIIKPEMPLEHI